MAAAALEVATAALADGGPVDAVGITNQRASTVVVGPDDRRAPRPRCGLAGPAHRRHVSHAQTTGPAAGAEPVGDQAGVPARHGRSGPVRRPSLCVRDRRHLDRLDALGRDHPRHRPVERRRHRAVPPRRLGVGPGGAGGAAHPRVEVLPEIVDSSAVVADATVLPGAPPIAGIVGDQQASLMGQGCVGAGQAKITFGTGGMLDLNVGSDRPAFERLGPARLLPDRGLAARRPDDLGTRGGHARRRHQRRVAARRHPHHRVRAGFP